MSQVARVGFVGGKINFPDPVFAARMVRVGVADENCIYGAKQLMVEDAPEVTTSYHLQKVFSDLMSARGPGPMRRFNVKGEEDGKHDG